MDINLDYLRDCFLKVISESSKQAIKAFYVFGSLARGEKVQEGSDVDSVLLVNTHDVIDIDVMQNLSRDLISLDKLLGITIDHVIVTEDDLLEILSKSLMLNILHDGIAVWGADLKDQFHQYLSTCSQQQILNSFLRTAMFKRHLLRKRVLKYDFSDLNSSPDKLVNHVAKEVIMLTGDYLFLFTDKLVTSGRDICSFFLANVKGNNDFVNFPMKAYNIRNSKIILPDIAGKIIFIKQGFSFIEEIVVRLQEKYKQITGDESLDLDPF